MKVSVERPLNPIRNIFSKIPDCGFIYWRARWHEPTIITVLFALEYSSFLSKMGRWYFAFWPRWKVNEGEQLYKFNWDW